MDRQGEGKIRETEDVVPKTQNSKLGIPHLSGHTP